MSSFQQHALLLVAVWLLLVVTRPGSSAVVKSGGLWTVALYALTALIRGEVSLAGLGLAGGRPWATTVVIALAWLALMLAYSPVADRLAIAWAPDPPDAPARLAPRKPAPALIALPLSGLLEELVLRGITLPALAIAGSAWMAPSVAIAAAALACALASGAIQRDQDGRTIIVTIQRALMLGLLFVLSGYNLWAVILCRGVYDVIALIGLARGSAQYSGPVQAEAG
jgi:hypothetical protein